MKKRLSGYLKNYVDEATTKELEEWLTVPPDSAMGDFSFPCFQLAKRLKESPQMVAQEIKESMEAEKEKQDFIESIQVVNGYLNFYLKNEWYTKWLLTQSITNMTSQMADGKDKTICIDYSSPNIAKNFHIGHLRTTMIGHSLYKIYQKLGYHVVGINHLGDWGTQFGKLITAYKNWGTKEEVEQGGLDELLRLYVMFHEKEEENPEIIEQARGWFFKMEQGDEEAMSLWKWFKEISLTEFQKIYDLLHITFDSYSGESMFMEQVPEVVELLKEKQLLVESEGANVVSLEEYEMPPCLITKSNGTSIYQSRDLAAALFRKKTYNFAKCLYVTGTEQQLHFRQVFHVLKKMGYDWWEDMVHIPYGLVSFQGGKLSSRSGNMVFAKELLEEAIARAREIIEEKNPNLKEKEKVAKQVGIGAVIFHDLFNVRIKNVSFAWDQVLNFDGATGPYVQYTFARANSILKKNGMKEECDYGLSGISEEKKNKYAPFYQKPVTKQMLKLLASYDDTIREAAQRYEPCVIARYAYALAQVFNQFYQECNIQHSEPLCKEAWVYLTYLAHHNMKDAMGLLGIECPEEM